MSGTEGLLTKTPSVTSKNSDHSRIVSRIPILNFHRGSLDSKTQSVPAFKHCSSQTKAFLSTADITNGNDGQLSPSLNQFEDSGYESPHSKANDTDTESQGYSPPRLQYSAPEHTSIPAIKSSRIPVCSDSTTRIRIQNASSQNSRNGKTKKEGPLKTMPLDLCPDEAKGQAEKKSASSFTEESFLRLTSSRVNTGSPAKNSEGKLKSSSISKSLSTIGNHETRSPGLSFDTFMKMPQPRFVTNSIRPVPLRSFANTPTSVPSFHSIIKESPSLQAIQAEVDQTVSEILETGTTEFSGKHCEWIQQVFNLQLEKIHGRLKQIYASRLETILKDKEADLLQVKQHYRSKLLDFEEATKKFQSWYDEVLEENKKQTKANEALLEEMKAKEAQLRKDYQIELEERILKLESDFEEARQQELARHAEQVKQHSDKLEAQNKSYVLHYESQIESLKKQIQNQKSRNSVLNEKFASQRRELPKLGDGESAAGGTDEEPSNGGEEMKDLIEKLQHRIQYLQAENKALTVEHEQEITKLQMKLDSNNQNLRCLIEETKHSIENTRTDRERRVRELKSQIQRKDEEHKIQMTQITQRYGKKIEDLTNSVQLLQKQLMG